MAQKGADWAWSWDVVWPATNTNDYIPQWDWANSKTLKNWIPTSTFATTATKLDAFATPDDNTNLNANTSRHWLLLKATAPAANELNVVWIANGETVYTNKDLFNTTNPANLWSVAAWTSIQASRSDHVHANPAIDTLAAATDITTLNATTTAHWLLLKATAPAAWLTNVVAIENWETVYKNKALYDATAPSTQAFWDTAAVWTAVTAARRDHKHAMPANPVSWTINEIWYFDSASTVKSLTTATYPSLTELSYVKWVTSWIQWQINAKWAWTVTSVAALTLGTTWTDLSSSVANWTTTPVITLNVPTASAANRWVLSAADWSTFNGKQAALWYTAENSANKENSTIDTSTTKYPTVNLLKSWLDAKQNTMTKAAGSDVDTGTDNDKYVTSKALKDSKNVPSVAPWTSGNVLTSNGTDWTSAAPSWWWGWYSNIDIQYFTSGSWNRTKPSWASKVIVEVVWWWWGGWWSWTTTNRLWAGGWGGWYARKMYSASSLGATEAYVVWAWWAWWAAGANNGTAGGTTSFSSSTKLVQATWGELWIHWSSWGWVTANGWIGSWWDINLRWDCWGKWIITTPWGWIQWDWDGWGSFYAWRTRFAGMWNFSGNNWVNWNAYWWWWSWGENGGATNAWWNGAAWIVIVTTYII
jgi:hypothetical protein